jgi:hypothetical protein
MILQEAKIGGKLYLDYDPAEMALPEAERVTFNYGPISNLRRVELLSNGLNKQGKPNYVEVCRAAIDELGKKVDNLKDKNGNALDTIEKILAWKDGGKTIAYMIVIIGHAIWEAQDGAEVGLKNSE